MSVLSTPTRPSINALRPDAEFGPVAVYLGEKSGKYPDGNQVIVRGRDACVAFDTPLVANRIGAAFDNVDLVILGHVHEDHMAGLHRVPQVPVHVHEADLLAAKSWDGLADHIGYAKTLRGEIKTQLEADFHYQPLPDAIGYADGAVWDLGGVRVRAVHMPGHTAGHSVLLVEPHGIAFIGDIDLSGFGPYYGDDSSSLVDFRQSIKRLEDLPASVWITSHHRGVVSERIEFVDALRAYASRLEEREQRLLQLLAEQPRKLSELVRKGVIYPPARTDAWMDGVERRALIQHLDELVLAGRVCRDAERRYALTAD